MDTTFCHSCGMPLVGENGKDFRGNFCLHCSDEKGNLKPREAVQTGIAEWLRMFSPDPSPDFMARADSYLKAMPAWAGQ